MTNLNILEVGCGGKTKQYFYLEEVIRRIENILEGKFGLQNIIAIMNIISEYSVIFNDGFIINEDKDIDRQIWRADSALILASILDDDFYNDKELKYMYVEYDKESSEYQRTLKNMISRIKNAKII